MPAFFFNDTATTEIYTLSLHDALPISGRLEWLAAFLKGRELGPSDPHEGASDDRSKTRADGLDALCGGAGDSGTRAAGSGAGRPCESHHDSALAGSDRRRSTCPERNGVDGACPAGRESANPGRLLGRVPRASSTQPAAAR